jgi:hypothetical protein
MKRSIVLMLILGLILGAMVPAHAGKKKARKATADYFAPAYFSWNPTGDHNIGGVSFPTGSGERFVSIEIADTAGMDVSAAVGQDPEGDGTVTTTPFCTSTPEPVPIDPGLEVTVFIFVGPCTDPAGPAFATQGTVTATFSKTP